MLSNLRVFSNHLRIEICRYGRDRVNRQYRICNMCSNEVENKYHCVIKCPLYEDIRNIYTVPSMEKCISLLDSNNNNILVKNGKFICFALIRKNETMNRN